MSLLLIWHHAPCYFGFPAHFKNTLLNLEPFRYFNPKLRIMALELRRDYTPADTALQDGLQGLKSQLLPIGIQCLPSGKKTI